MNFKAKPKSQTSFGVYLLLENGMFSLVINDIICVCRKVYISSRNCDFIGVLGLLHKEPFHLTQRGLESGLRLVFVNATEKTTFNQFPLKIHFLVLIPWQEWIRVLYQHHAGKTTNPEIKLEGVTL